MEPLVEEVRNTCGHLARYIIIVDTECVDIESEINEECDVCEKEDEEFKKQIAKKLNKYLGD